MHSFVHWVISLRGRGVLWGDEKSSSGAVYAKLNLVPGLTVWFDGRTKELEVEHPFQSVTNDVDTGCLLLWSCDNVVFGVLTSRPTVMDSHTVQSRTGFMHAVSSPKRTIPSANSRSVIRQPWPSCIPRKLLKALLIIEFIAWLNKVGDRWQPWWIPVSRGNSADSSP